LKDETESIKCWKIKIKKKSTQKDPKLKIASKWMSFNIGIKIKFKGSWFFLLNDEIEKKSQFNKRIIKRMRIKIEIKKLEENYKFFIKWWNWKEKSLFEKRIIQRMKIKIKTKNKLEDNNNFFIEGWNWKEKLI
jgi:hypothetical protein